MPTLQAIISDIDARYTNVFSTAQKVTWLNIVQNEVFREMSIEEILEFSTVADTAIYDISQENIVFDNIKTVTIDNEEYSFKGLNEELDGYNYFKVLDTNTQKIIGFYPTPEEVETVRIFYEKRPAELSSDDLTVTPDLREDWQEILKYGVMRIMAEARDEIEKANNYTLQYNTLLKEIKDKRYKNMPKYPQVKNAYPFSRTKRQLRPNISEVLDID